MLPVAGRPIAAHAAEAAVQAGASSLVFVVGHKAEIVREHFGEEYTGVPVSYATQERQQGTADAVRAAKTHLQDGPFAVVNGDTVADAESYQILFANAPAVGTYRVDDPTQYGVFEVADDRVTSVVEKPADPPSDLINTGVYAFPAEARAWLDVESSKRGELELTDVLAKTCAEYTVTPVPFYYWLDIGRPWELLEANEWALSDLEQHIEGEVSEDAQLSGRVHVAEGATIRSGVVIEGPVYIDSGATVGPNAYVRGNTYIGPDAKVGHAVEVKNSIFREGATASHLSYVGDSILGRDVNLGAGTTVANLRHDDETVRTPIKGELTDTGRRKFGVVLGDDVKTGINSSLNAGVKLASGTTTAVGETVVRDKE
jgi:bifunctional UDP-N-acetylglucosamine pyrophosphorylase/glucosamine-1-phosphate N-acetyltransferase